MPSYQGIITVSEKQTFFCIFPFIKHPLSIKSFEITDDLNPAFLASFLQLLLGKVNFTLKLAPAIIL